jgi:hypothetical protein
MSKSKFGSYGDFTNLRDYILDIYTEPTPGTSYDYNYSNFSSNNSHVNGVPGPTNLTNLTSLVSGVAGVTDLSGFAGFAGIQELNELREELNELRSGISILSKEYYFFQTKNSRGVGRGNEINIIKNYNYEYKNKCESVSGKVDKNFIEILQFLIAQFIKRNNPISTFNYSLVPGNVLEANEEINISDPEPNKNFKLYFPREIELKLNEEDNKIIQKIMTVAPQHMPTYPYYEITVTTNVDNGGFRPGSFDVNVIKKDDKIIEQNGGNREYYGRYKYTFVLSYFNTE